MNQSEMLKLEKGFNTDYFKIGQLIKVTVKDFRGMFLETDYGFITNVSFDKIVFTYINVDGELKEKPITPVDLCREDLDINIEILSNKAITMGV